MKAALLLALVFAMFVTRDGRASTDECRVDAICSDALGWENQARSVVRFEVDKADDTYFGTGTFIHDPGWPGRPLILTAAHVVATGDRLTEDDVATFPDRARLRFQWRAAQCGGRPAQGSWQDVSAIDLQATIVAYDNLSDMALVELGVPLDPAWNVYLSGWKGVGNNPPYQGVVLHHGNADPLRYALTPEGATYFYYDDESALLVYEYLVDIVEAASSGSAYFDTSDQRIVGVTSSEQRPPPGFDCSWAPETVFGRFDVAYTRTFNAYMGAGATWASGHDPYGGDDGESDASILPAELHAGETFELGYTQTVSIPPGFHAQPGCQMHLYPAP